MVRGNRGQVLVLVALALFVLLGFAALGIDVGYMYSVRHELQRSADAGALAGASALRQYGKNCLDSTSNEIYTYFPITKDEAIARALDYARRDNVSTKPLTIPEVLVSCPAPGPKNPLMRVRVDVERNAPLFFGRVLGWDNTTIKAFAVAEAFPITAPTKCVVPWGIPAPWSNTAAPTTDNSYNQGDRVNWEPKETDCANNPTITTWDYSTHKPGLISSRDQFLCQGSLQQLKIGTPQSSSISGNFYGIDIHTFVIPGSCPGVNLSGGAPTYIEMTQNPCACELKIDLNAPLPPVPTEPGMMVGPTLTAVAPNSYYKSYGGDIPGQPDPNSLMNQDPNAYWDDQKNMPVSLDPRYSDNNWAKSPRVVRIPIYNPDSSSNGGLNTPPGGSAPFQPLAFIGFWVQDIVYIDKDPETNKQLGTVVGRFVTVEGPGGGGEESGGTVFNIRLVE